jgi:ribosome-binding protein aMBF1 (putative translation factor)
MIKEKTFGNPMTTRESFESFYAKKLEALRIELNKIIVGDNPYITGDEYACFMCRGRVKVRSQCRVYCLQCQTPLGWTKAQISIVARIMKGYPSIEESRKEWEALQQAPTPHEISFARVTKQGDIELGKRIREARITKGWSREDLAMQVFKQFCQGNIAPSSIQAYENGNANPSQHVLEQLQKLLGLEVTQDVQ